MTLEETVQLRLDGHLSYDGETIEDFTVKISFSNGDYHDITGWLWENNPIMFEQLAQKYSKKLRGE